jgi:small-conductance mechanosensitive channel/CRP-like cAMP-binding protein
MTVWHDILRELLESRTAFAVLALVLTAAVISPRDIDERRRLRLMTVFLGLHVIAAIIAGAFKTLEPAAYLGVHITSMVLIAVSAIGMGISLLFHVALPKVGIKSPPILRDVVGAAALFAAVLFIAGQAGINVSGLIATSAVLTAVVGLSLQDTLGNLMAGLALQSDNSVRVGDWVKVDDTWGQVQEMRWRYTAIETRDWEVLIIPNSQLVKGHFKVLGRAKGRPVQWRRWVFFNVDFRYPPQDVIDTVREALSTARIQRVATTPPPDCILKSFEDSYARYAVRYFLNDIRVDDPTDSEVRSVVHAALKRRNIPLSIPAEARFITHEDETRTARKQAVDVSRRAKVLANIDLFRDLTDDDRRDLAQRMRIAPFHAGEILTRQGAEGHELYLLADGRASVRVSADNGVEREVATLGPGEVFGEMSLMTGAKRAATVVAVTDIEAYRLDKSAFERVLHDRPEIAEHFADVLAKRQMELAAAKEDLDHLAARSRMDKEKTDLLARIRGFFGIDLER